jgi:hypothetical protein
MSERQVRYLIRSAPEPRPLGPWERCYETLHVFCENHATAWHSGPCFHMMPAAVVSILESEMNQRARGGHRNSSIRRVLAVDKASTDSFPPSASVVHRHMSRDRPGRRRRDRKGRFAERSGARSQQCRWPDPLSSVRSV